MLELRAVAGNIDEVRAQLARRGFRDEAILGVLAERAAERRGVITELEALRARRNEAGEAMAKLDKKSSEFGQRRDELRATSDTIKKLETRHKTVELSLEEMLLQIPNLPHASTPDGKGEADNPVVRSWGEKTEMAFAAKDHVDLGTALGIIDFERAAKVSGARFSVLMGHGARLERAIMSFMLDLHTVEHGYTEVWSPVLVNGSALRGTGQLPKFEKDLFKIAQGWGAAEDESARHDLYLIPTAEVPLTNLHADEILHGANLPIAYTGYTACFRSEAGSYGKDTRGMIRQHQFDKVELVRFCRPEDGERELELLTGHAEKVLQKLGLHYRVSALCAADISFSSMKTYDIEVWLPGQNAFREISSCSWFGDFQARRAQIRFRRDPKGKPELVHTLNGSGLAIGRTLVAILEQFQRPDGSVRIPEALHSYMGGVSVIKATT